MRKASDRLDSLSKVLDLQNYYIDSQKETILREIIWLEENYANPTKLRAHFAKNLYLKIMFSDENLQQLAEIRGNILYSQLRGLDHQKVETLPLKIIVQELKHKGQ